MNKLLVFFVLTITITLSSCTPSQAQLDYNDFTVHQVSSYFTSEQVSSNRYILYYYDSTDEPSNNIKSYVLNFFDDFDLLEYYLLDTTKIQSETSDFGEYSGEPIIYVISSNKVYETYTGSEEIKNFIYKYNNITFDYDLFENQKITTYQEALEIVNDGYIVYYYLTSCPHCIYTEPYFLPWAFTKSAEDIYFMDGATVEHPDQIPTELVILNSGTPILVLMSNGKFSNEFYSGSEDVIGYINRTGLNDIKTTVSTLDYNDFPYAQFNDFGQSLIISDELHLEYYYSSYCGHCKKIKPDLLSFFNELEVLEFYIMDTSKSIGVPSIKGFNGVPVLYLVKDNQVVAEYLGSAQIPAFIEAYKNGEIDLSIYD